MNLVSHTKGKTKIEYLTKRMPEENMWKLTERKLQYGEIHMKISIICNCSWVTTPLWSNGQSSWLQIQRPRFDSGATRFFEK
jgi:hypothetical protein